MKRRDARRSRSSRQRAARALSTGGRWTAGVRSSCGWPTRTCDRWCPGGRSPAAARAARMPAVGSARISMELSAPDIVALHDLALAAWPGDALAEGDFALPPPSSPRPHELRELVEAAHAANKVIWRLEDEARRRDVADARIAAIKRAIDPWNQRRNDLMEAIDAAVLAHYAQADLRTSELHSETAGMMIDRLSILALKIRSIEALAAAARASGDSDLERECTGRSVVLREQRSDLAACLARLLEDFAAG